MNDYLEDEYRPAYEEWQKNQTPESNAIFLSKIEPVIQKGLKMYGGESPLAASRAKLLTLAAMRKYDPSRSRLQSHVLTQLQPLRRVTQQQSNVLRVPERILLESHRLQSAQQELADELGRDPSDAELSDKLGVPFSRLNKIRAYQPGVTSGQLDAHDPLSGGAAGRLPGSEQKLSDLWVQIVHQDLNPKDQQILEYSLGLNGKPKLANQAIAKKLGITPGAVSQRKVGIQKLLDQEQTLSPFVVN